MLKKFGAMDHYGISNMSRNKSKEEWQEAHSRWRESNTRGWLERAWEDKDQAAVGKMTKQAGMLKEEVEAMREILWRTAKNKWFEYSLGSWLLNF